MAATRVQYSHATSTSVTLSSTPITGNLLVLTVSIYNNPNRTVSSISQTGVTWTRQIDGTGGYSGYGSLEIWTGVVGAGALTGTLNLSGAASYISVNVCEYNGVLVSGYIDQTAEATGASATPSTGTTSVTTQADELWVGSTYADFYSQSSPTNSFTLLDGTLVGSVVSNAFLERIVSSTGTAGCSTTVGGLDSWIGGIITIFAGEPEPPIPGALQPNYGDGFFWRVNK